MSFLGLDWDSLYAQAETQVKNSVQDIVSTGVPAIKAGLEQQAINWLTEQNKQTQAELKENVGAVLSRPSDPNSLGGAISSATVTAAAAQYGPLILLGVGGLLVFGFYLRK